MSRRQDIQSAEGVMCDYRGYGVVQQASKVNPTNGVVGFSPSAEWFNLVNGTIWVNVGGNGFGTNTTAIWVETDPTAGQQMIFGGSTSALMNTSGTLYRNILTVANGISASATGADKIVDAYLLPAGTLTTAGKGLQITVWGTLAATGNTKEVKVILGATNAAGFLTNGTVTVTGGSVIGDSGAVTTNAAATWELSCQIFKTVPYVVNKQESMTTGIVFATSHLGVGAWTDQTFTEANALQLVITLNCTTAITDLVYQGCLIQGLN